MIWKLKRPYTREEVETILKHYGIYIFHINGSGVIIDNDSIHSIPEKDVNELMLYLLQEREPKRFMPVNDSPKINRGTA